MFKLMKYEIKGRYKTTLAICLGILLVNAYVFIKSYSLPADKAYAAVIPAAFALIIFSFLIPLIRGEKMYQRDLYGDTGYLMFTIPQKGTSIIGSKVLLSFIEFILFEALSVLSSLVIISRLPESKLVMDILGNYMAPAIRLGFAFISVYLFILVLIFFSHSISKAALNKNKYSKPVSGIILIILAYSIGKLNDLITAAIPYKLNIIGKPVVEKFGDLSITIPSFEINIASTIFNILIFIGIFVGASYLLEKKVDF